MKKTVVLLYPEFSEYELSVALSILMQGKKPVTVAGVEHQPIIGESGLTIIPDCLIDEIDLEKVDSLLLTGCMNIMALSEKETLFDFITQVASKNMVIASISSSPFLLAKAGVLKGKKYTAGLTEDFLDKVGVFEKGNYSHELVVQDGNIITAKGRGFIKFGKCLGNALKLDFDESWYET